MNNARNRSIPSEKMQTIAALNNGLRHAISCGLVSNRSDVIRQLCKGGFEIVRVTNNDVTICIPDEPEELLTLTGYIYTRDFEIQPPGWMDVVKKEKDIRRLRTKDLSEESGREGDVVVLVHPDSRKIAKGIMFTGSYSLAIWGLVSCLMWWLYGHSALLPQAVTPTVVAVIAQVSGVLSISIMPVCVLLFLMESFQVWWDKRKYRAMKKKVSWED
ncbi:hypothetical protein C3984_01180 [Escherichia coli]|nr:hypothetical protein C3984_01180 [Escherichia coli]